MASLLLNTVQNTFYKHKINKDSSLLILKKYPNNTSKNTPNSINYLKIIHLPIKNTQLGNFSAIRFSR